MDPLMVILRILHIVSGVLYAGNTFFLALLLEPKLRSLGPAVQGPVMRALIPVLIPTMTVSSAVVIGSGAAIALILRWGDLDRFLVTGWGWAMLLGFVMTVASTAVGLGFTSVVGRRLESLARTIAGRSPSPQEASQLRQLSHRLETLTRTNFVLVLIAVGAMAAARYV